MNKLFFRSFVIFLLFFVGFSYLFVDPNLFYLDFFYTDFFQLHRYLTTIFFTSSLLVFFLFYLAILYTIKQNKLSSKELFFLLITTVCILLFSYPAMLSFDIFNYIATAKVTFFYHENPYILMPMEFTRDPLLTFMHAANKTALYAPFWILLTGIPFLLGFGSFLVILFNFKILVVIFYIATVLLIWNMTKSLYKTAFFACNPLVIIEVLVSGHNDIVMMFLLLLSLYFFLNKKTNKTIYFYIFSVGIKYVTGVLVILLPFLVKKQWKQEKIFLLITISMFCVFLLSSFREEIYPWYALWFLVPGTFLIDKKPIQYFFISISFGLLLRYIPFMFLGTYFGPTPILKIIFMLLPTAFLGLGYAFKKIKS